MTNLARHTVAGLAAPQRLDKTLRAAFPNWSRKETEAAINEKRVRVNGQPIWLGSWQVKNGDKITVTDPPQEIERGPETFDPAWIIADAGEVIAIDKPAGLLSEANRWGKGVNLWALAEAHFGAKLTLFHRLDRDTSGVILFTRNGANAEFNRMLDRQFQQRSVQKTYYAHVAHPNQLAASGEIRKPLGEDPRHEDRMKVVRSGGKWALTRYETLAPRGNFQPVWLHPETGRTHQLRVHLASMGAPILGDRLYGNAATAPRLMLHAHAIMLPGMAGFPEYRFVAPIPREFGDIGKLVDLD